MKAIGSDGRLLASTRIAGAFGIPAVTSDGAAGGLSPDGRLLVLVQPPRYDGLRRQSRFVVLSTAKLARVGDRSPCPASSASTRSPPTGASST